MQNAEYWTAIMYDHGGRYRLECKTFLEAAQTVKEQGCTRNLIYAVRHPNQALAVTCVQGVWELTKLRGIEHPLKDFIVEGKLHV